MKKNKSKSKKIINKEIKQVKFIKLESNQKLALTPIYPRSTKTIEQERQNWKYRFFESFTGMSAVIFITIMILLAVFAPGVLAIFLIVYSFFIVLKSGLHTIYTFYTFKNIYRWEDVPWFNLLDLMKKKPLLAVQEMDRIGKLHKDKFNWGTN